MTRSKKLGLLLIPLIPLSALGVVTIVNGLIPPEPTRMVEVTKPTVQPVAPQPAPPVQPAPSLPPHPTASR